MPRAEILSKQALHTLTQLHAELAAKTHTGNPWVKRGTLYSAAIDPRRRSGTPMTAREIMPAVLHGKTPALVAIIERPRILNQE